MPKRRVKRSEPSTPQSEPDTTYLELARRIRDEVERAARDDTAFVLSIRRAIDGLAQEERARFAMGVFDTLGVDRQLALLRELFDDDELRALLGVEMEQRMRRSDRSTSERALVDSAVDGTRFDLAALPSGVELTFGLFRPDDVTSAIPLGPRSDLCARELRCRTGDEPGRMTVVNDTFNPRGSLVMTAAYDRQRWEREHLESHALVRIGSMTPSGFTPVVHLGARVDIERAGEAHAGLLHLGFALVGSTDAFGS